MTETNSSRTARVLPNYRVRACNTSAESENKIHDDATATAYGFRGGLVPGVTVYGYMTVPIVAEFGLAWIERGTMQVKFLQPLYHGEPVTVRAEVDEQSNSLKINVMAEREDGTLCATGLADLGRKSMIEPSIDDYPELPLPIACEKPSAVRDAFKPGAAIGTLKQRVDLMSVETSLLSRIAEKLPLYFGANAVAHPAFILGLSNLALTENFKLGPWIHAASEVVNWRAVTDGDEISVRGRIAECYERKGHEFVVLDLLLTSGRGRVVQQVRHTAIYRPRLRVD